MNRKIKDKVRREIRNLKLEISLKWMWAYCPPSTISLRSSRAFNSSWSYFQFTRKQTNATTWQKQCELWSQVIREHAARSKQPLLQPSVYPLFTHAQLKRRLSPSTRQSLLEWMLKQEHVHSLDADTFVVWYKPLDAWCTEMKQWAQMNGMRGQVCTLYELASEEEGGPMAGLDVRVVSLVVQSLQKQGIVAVISAKPGAPLEETGIKWI